MRLLTPACAAMASTRAPPKPRAANSAVAAARIEARVRSGSRRRTACRPSSLPFAASAVISARDAARGEDGFCAGDGLFGIEQHARLVGETHEFCEMLRRARVLLSREHGEMILEA